MAYLVQAVIKKTRDYKIYRKILLTSGRHCCLWCHITSASLKIPLSVRGRSLNRTLQTLRSDHDKFLQAGGNIKNAKHFNNVIDKAMFDIPLMQVRHKNDMLNIIAIILLHTYIYRFAFQAYISPWVYLKESGPYSRTAVPNLTLCLLSMLGLAISEGATTNM